MYTEGVLAQTAKTNLKSLIETAGRVFPNDNNDCIGMIVQIDPATDAAQTVEVIGSNSSSGIGIILSIDPDVGPNFVAFRCSKVEHVDLESSLNDVLTRVLVETVQ